MKSFKNFLEEQGRKEFLENRPKTQAELDAARERLAKTPVLSDDEMRAQNPSATAAYEKDVKERQSRKSVTVDTPEGQITAGGTSRSGKIPIQTSSGKTIYVTPDEAIARAEAGLKQPVKNKPKKVISTSKPSTQPAKPAPAAAPAPVKPVVPAASTKPAPAPVKPPKPASAPVKPAAPVKPSSVTLSLTRPDVPKVSKGPSLSVSTPKPTTTAANIEKVGKSLLKQMRADKAAEKAAKSVATAKAWRNAGRLAGLGAAAYDAKTGYDTARSSGASQKRALGSGAARAVGGLLGGAVGSTLGSVAGLPGAIVGGTAGYTAGSELASRAYNKVTGPLGKKLTTQGVLTNIRTAVPREVRAQIPTNVRKGFTDFVKSAGRTYGQWSRSQGGNK